MNDPVGESSLPVPPRWSLTGSPPFVVASPQFTKKARISRHAHVRRRGEAVLARVLPAPQDCRRGREEGRAGDRQGSRVLGRPDDGPAPRTGIGTLEIGVRAEFSAREKIGV